MQIAGPIQPTFTCHVIVVDPRVTYEPKMLTRVISMWNGVSVSKSILAVMHSIAHFQVNNVLFLTFLHIMSFTVGSRFFCIEVVFLTCKEKIRDQAAFLVSRYLIYIIF